MFEKTPIAGIIFDLDGTLVHFKIDFSSLRREIIEVLYESQNFPSNFFSLQDRVLVIIQKARDFFLKSNPQDEWSRINKDLDMLIRRYEWEGAKVTTLVPAALETLNVLMQNNFKIGLFTLEPRDITEFILEKPVLINISM